jgi:Esterase-like activity of phytase
VNNLARRVRQALGLLLVIALAPGTWLRSPEPPPNYEQALRVVPLDTGPQRLGPFRVAGVWQLTSPNSLFGSYSALVEPAPGRLLALSDRGHYLAFAAPGSGPGPVRIATLAGRPVRYKHFRDLESATRDPVSGKIYVALEVTMEVARYGPDLAFEAQRRVPEIQHWNDNSGPEAMVRLGDGRFAILCECTTGLFASGTHPALLLGGDPSVPAEAHFFTFAGPAGYRPTDAALLPDGRVLVLARRLTWPMPPRFRAKLLLADPAGIAPGETWQAVELASIEAPLPVDNFEALTVSTGADGQLTAWLLSDDNQALTQRSLLWKLEFSLDDLPSAEATPARSRVTRRENVRGTFSSGRPDQP